ncbi:hypothetical protein D9611_007712 [Ephemerocybe angulata]|uniref:Uncharacterized protein n=2 Tax=Ephemerocybe angulata TaxID=980116 RepID=A0A8H5BZ35_9AGAR|nr:hypothetical protein D9611_007712 [Tulosesus angulatus]KAF6762655.1 rheb small monomeric GTPase RhbA [Tulosesus angulatus]
MSRADGLKRRKIAVLGSRSVGKSSLVLQFVENNFVESYYPTIDNSVSKKLKYGGKEFECEIIDTAGQDEFSIFNAKHAIGIHGYVLVYSIATQSSFDMIPIIYDKIVDFCGVRDIPCVIVGSKMDLQANRQVDAAAAEALAQQSNAAYIETSAKNDVNVAKVFELCLAEIEKKSAPSSPATETKGSCSVM